MKCLSCFWLIGSSATSMRTASLRWLSGWKNPGKAPQHWSKRWVHFFQISLDLFSSSRVFYAYTEVMLHIPIDMQNLISVNFSSGGTTRPQPPTCYCCPRSRGGNLSASALSHQSAATPTLLCSTERRSGISTAFCLDCDLLSLVYCGISYSFVVVAALSPSF